MLFRDYGWGKLYGKVIDAHGSEPNLTIQILQGFVNMLAYRIGIKMKKDVGFVFLHLYSSKGERVLYDTKEMLFLKRRVLRTGKFLFLHF